MHLLINLAENGHFGCAMKCPFCEWSKQDYNKYWFPSDEELDYALSISPRVLVLSGGGDPLYHYDKNRDKILHFVNYVTQHGARAGIYSHDIPTLWAYREELGALPVQFTISINRIITPIEQQVIEYYGRLNKLRRVSVVFNDDNVHEPDWDAITNIIAICKPLVRTITFREHWIYPYADREKVNEWRERIYATGCCNLICSNRPLSVRVMFDGKITTCGDIDRDVLKIK